jgi:hypothetical protein
MSLRALVTGRVLAVRRGLNPNSSSLGVDVSYLLLGAAALAVITPTAAIVARLLLAWRARRRDAAR